MYPAIIVTITLIVAIAVTLLTALLLSKGNVQRVAMSARTCFKVLSDDNFANKVKPLLIPSANEEDKLDARPIRLLTILQREGRLLDFLMEDLEGATDEQIAAGVREIHKDCRKAVNEYLQLEPVIPHIEGETVDIPSGFDPSAIQLTGNITGEPPFKGQLSHPGWRVTSIKLAEPAEGVDELVVQPAEVELP